MIKINEQIPEMEVGAYHDGEETRVKLSDYKGKWLAMIFYPADFTFVCPTELEEAADLYDTFREEGAEIVSVSTDTHFVHKAWHDTSPAIGKIRFPMLADPTGQLSRAFGTYIEEAGVALRGTFIIDPDGVVKSMEMNDLSIGRSGKELLRKLRAAKYVRENNGEVCPASWEPGTNTLSPSLDLVGKL
ncbi:MAG: peroxiredoxin [bacterium]|nr:peroxiredoxin [bacterium]